MARVDYDGTEIAVVGMAGRFPGARDVAELWRNLQTGRRSFSHRRALVCRPEDDVAGLLQRRSPERVLTRQVEATGGRRPWQDQRQV